MKEFAGEKFIFNSGHLILETISRLLKIPKIRGWGTISSIALDLLNQLGFTEIALVGMDFSYKGGQSHATGYAFRGRREKTIQRENRFGQHVETTTTLEGYAEFVDRQISKLIEDNRKIIDLMEGGLLRHGTPMTARHYLHHLLNQEDQPKPGYQIQRMHCTAATQETIKKELATERAHVETLLKQHIPGESTMTELFSTYPLSIIEGSVINEARDFESILIGKKQGRSVSAEWSKFKQLLLNRLQETQELLAVSISCKKKNGGEDE